MFLYIGRVLSVLYNQRERGDDDQNSVLYALGHGSEYDTDEIMIINFECRFNHRPQIVWYHTDCDPHNGERRKQPSTWQRLSPD